LLHRLGEEKLPVAGSHLSVDVWAVRRDGSLTVLLTNHTMPRQPIAPQTVRLELLDAPQPIAALLERIDGEHANAKAAWIRMGEPEYLSPSQVDQLEQASRLEPQPLTWTYEDGKMVFQIGLPPHAVAALTIRFPSP
jgi:xylan 1,4-beta-xylosidase